MGAEWIVTTISSERNNTDQQQLQNGRRGEGAGQ